MGLGVNQKASTAVCVCMGMLALLLCGWAGLISLVSWLIDPMLILVCSHIFICQPIEQMKQLLPRDFTAFLLCVCVLVCLCEVKSEVCNSHNISQ